MARGRVDHEVRLLLGGIARGGRPRRRTGPGAHHPQVRGLDLGADHAAGFHADRGQTEARGDRGKVGRGDKPRVEEGRREHIARDAGDALEEERPAHRAPAAADRTARTTWQAAKPAEKPLSMFATVTPGAQQLSIASSALRPPKFAP